MQTTLLNTDSHILKYLSDKGLDYLDKYPTAAIAGASIASLILKEDNLPINDVDVFVVDEDHEKYDSAEARQHEYELLAASNGQEFYKILDVETEGIKNIIYCHSNYSVFGEGLIESFDFNCVQAAVVKKNGQYYLLETDHFVKFKQTKVVEVVGIRSPIQTLIRYYKKQTELPYKFDALSLKRLELICSAPQFTNETIHTKFKKYVPEDEQDLFDVEWSEDNEEFCEITRDNLFGLNKHELISDLNVISKVYLNSNKATKERYAKIKDYPNVLKAFCYYGVDSIKQDFSTKNIETYEKYLALIPSFIGLLENNKTIAGLFNHLEGVKQLANHNVLVRENLSMYLAFSATKNNLAEFEKMIGSDVKLVEPLDLSDFEHSGKVEELVTSGRLKIEGDSMHHCVGGYSDKVKRGKCRIFRLIDDGSSSTLELNEKFQIVQNYGIQNSHPKYTLDNLAKLLARYLTDNVKSLDKPTTYNDVDFVNENVVMF